MQAKASVDRITPHHCWHYIEEQASVVIFGNDLKRALNLDFILTHPTLNELSFLLLTADQDSPVDERPAVRLGYYWGLSRCSQSPGKLETRGLQEGSMLGDDKVLVLVHEQQRAVSDLAGVVVH